MFCFTDITLHKAFPDEKFTVKPGKLNAIIDPMTSNVYLANEDGTMSVKVPLKDWIESDGLCRSDTPVTWY